MKFIESTRREIVRVCHSRHPSSPSAGPPPSRGAKAGGITSVAETIRYAAYLACIIVTAIARVRRFAVALLSLQNTGAFSEEGWRMLDGGPPFSFSLSLSLFPSSSSDNTQGRIGFLLVEQFHPGYYPPFAALSSSVSFLHPYLFPQEPLLHLSVPIPVSIFPASRKNYNCIKDVPSLRSSRAVDPGQPAPTVPIYLLIDSLMEASQSRGRYSKDFLLRLERLVWIEEGKGGGYLYTRYL